MRFFLTILFGATLIAGCSHSSTLATKIQNAGGVAVLVKDWHSIFDEHLKTQKEFWMANDSSLPAAIAALQPQVVQATKYDDLPMVDIQITGGFRHNGLLILLTNAPPNLVPQKSNWSVTKITEGVFEYRE